MATESDDKIMQRAIAITSRKCPHRNMRFTCEGDYSDCRDREFHRLKREQQGLAPVPEDEVVPTKIDLVAMKKAAEKMLEETNPHYEDADTLANYVLALIQELEAKSARVTSLESSLRKLGECNYCDPDGEVEDKYGNWSTCTNCDSTGIKREYAKALTGLTT